jgi:hypothetical protein
VGATARLGDVASRTPPRKSSKLTVEIPLGPENHAPSKMVAAGKVNPRSFAELKYARLGGE